MIAMGVVAAALEGVAAKKFEGQFNDAYRVQNYDSVAVAEGYHPLCCAPGYSMYFLA